MDYQRITEQIHKMNIDKVLIQDPKTKEKSVSFTMLVIALISLVSAGILQVMGKTDTTGPFAELLYTSTALYFGRRLKVSGKDYESKKEEE